MASVNPALASASLEHMAALSCALHSGFGVCLVVLFVVFVWFFFSFGCFFGE